MNKPTIPNEVADTIESLRNIHKYDNLAIVNIASRTGGGVSKATKILSSIPFDTLLTALVNGYERELTEEKRTYSAIKKEWYTNSFRRNSSYSDGFADGIEFVLGELSIEIEGVNA